MKPLSCSHVWRWLLLVAGLWGAIVAEVAQAARPAQVVGSSYLLWEQEATTIDVPSPSYEVKWDRLLTLYPNDDDRATLNIGFAFPFGSSSYSQVQVLTNGILQFVTSDRLFLYYNNSSLPSSNGSQFIAPYWDDLVDDSQASVTWGNMGESPRRRFVVTWNNVRAYDNNLRYNFQAVLYENGDIRFRYFNNTANGQSATIGLELTDTDYLQYSYNQTSVATSFDLLFRKSSLVLPDAVVSYRLDEGGWTGAAAEVQDSGTAGLDGRALNGVTASDRAPAISDAIGTCGYAGLDGVDDYIEVADNNLLDMRSALAVGVWIRLDAWPSDGMQTILSKDENYEFHINSQGQLYWWWTTSAGVPLSITTAASVTVGKWHHIVISYQRGNQAIYMDGVLTATANYNDELMLNSDPVQVGADQNMAGRFFAGDIDEINIFDQALTRYQVIELMERTRPCSAANLCASSFPDGLSSYTGGTIRFDRNAQLFFSPTDSLYASGVSDDSSSTLLSCVSTRCSANGMIGPAPAQPTFPTGISGSNVSVAAGKSLTLENSSSYRRVTVGDYATLAFSAARSSYELDSLITGTGVILSLTPGSYWVRSLSLGLNNQIRINGSGSVQIYVKDSTNIGSGLLANSPSAGTRGDIGALLLYNYAALTLGSGTTLTGMVFAGGNFTLGASSTLFGAVTADNLILNSGSKVYYSPSAVMDTDFGSLCSRVTCDLGGFYIEQPVYALACPSSRSAIRVQALCADGQTIKDDYQGTLQLAADAGAATRFYRSESASTEILTLTLDGSEEGDITFYMANQAENHALRIVATDQASGVSSRGAGTDVRAQGFLVTRQPDDFVCGASTSMTLVAVGQNPEGSGCLPLAGFSGAKALKAWFGASLSISPEVTTTRVVSTPLLINGTAVSAQSQPLLSNLDLDFVDGAAQLSLQYGNAATLLGLNFYLDDAPYADTPEAQVVGIGPLAASTNGLAVRPERIALSLPDAGYCAAADASCAPQLRAGESFNVELAARCEDDSIATDYRGVVTLGAEVLVPAGADAGVLGVQSVTLTDTDQGQQTLSQTLSEVGVFALTSTASWQDMALTNEPLTALGRIVPHHFDASAPLLSQTCGAFVYMDQPGITASVHLRALNSDGGITRNYRGELAKAVPQWQAENANNGLDLSARLASSGTLSWQNGEADLLQTLTFGRTGLPDGPYEQLAVGLALDDADGGFSLLQGLDFDAASTGDCLASNRCSALQLGIARALFGRLDLANVIGPELDDLYQPLRALYRDSNGQWRVNDADSCTDLSMAAPTLAVDDSSWEGALNAGETAPLALTPMVAGEGGILHSAPGLDNSGSVLYRYQPPTWLRTETDGDNNYQDNASGRISFGQYRGNDRVIYWREQKR